MNRRNAKSYDGPLFRVLGWKRSFVQSCFQDAFVTGKWPTVLQYSYAFSSTCSLCHPLKTVTDLIMPSLTGHLLQLDPRALEDASQHPFLRAAATNQLRREDLMAWFAQDRHYQRSYINFIAGMLFRISLSGDADRLETLEGRTVVLLIGCLTNIVEEVKLFDKTGEAEGWVDDIGGVEPSVQTRSYQDLFAGAIVPSRPFLVGIAVLWATELCYLRAWQYTRSFVDLRMSATEQGIVQKTLIPNWTSTEFEAFVEVIRNRLDEFGRGYDEFGPEWKECTIAWRQVLRMEREFWPGVDQ